MSEANNNNVEESRRDSAWEPLALLDASEDLFAVADANYRYLWANEAYCRSRGKTLAELVGRKISEVIGPHEFEKVMQPYLDLCFQGTPQRFEAERHVDGLGWRKLLVRYFPIQVRDGAVLIGGAVITDITEARQSEERLASQSRLLQMAGLVARFGGWAIDLVNDSSHWSDVVADIHGMPRGYSPSLDQALDFYLPEHRDRIREAVNACAEHGTAFDEKLAIRSADGREVWVRAIGEPVLDLAGRIVSIQGALQDITAQHAREKALNWQAQIIRQSPAPMMVTDLEGRIEYVNAAFEKSSGYTSSELLGQTPVRIRSDNTPQSVYRDLWATISAGKVWTGELQNRRKDGSLYWEKEVITPIADKKGRVIHYAAIKEDITSLKEAEQELSRMAFEDPLTGLYSRNGFARHLDRWIEKHGWSSFGAVVMVDIMGLRDINDAVGYEGGDRLLVEFGQRLVAQAGEHGCVGRIGGDEFVLFLSPASDEVLQDCLAQLAESLSAPFEIDGLVFEISSRLGFSRLAEQQRSIEDLLREAERALFQHREQPSEPWVAHSRALEDEIRQRVELTRELRVALENEQFELHFQPKVDLASGKLVACEALLRWNHPERGMVSPGTFIPTAEKSQLIAPIGDWALRRACQHLREWRDAGLEPVRVAVNVSVIQFQTGDFASRVRTVLEECGVAPHELALEITESVFEREADLLLSQMLRLREMGVWLSLDDFGTGYSSLLYLQR
ncbi:MAG: EAL domain-containing protein, partial [Halomonas sp.]|nr:EAL domain-containing protein [Halomonas sp.]